MKNNIKIQNLITYGMMVVLFAIMFTMLSTGSLSRQMQNLLIPICINIILAVSLNLTVGFLGELTLGHAGFMSVGAYTGCMVSIQLVSSGTPLLASYLISMIVGGLAAAAFGIIIGVPVLRLKGDYLAIVTLAFGEIIKNVITNLDFLGGASGLKGTTQITDRKLAFFIAFAVIMIMLFIIMNLVNSRHGRAIRAIRDNRIAVESIGTSITYHKLLVFVISAFFAGIAGVIYGHNINIVQASSFDYNRSIEILVIVVLGGMGSIRGSVIAAIILTVLPEWLRAFSDYRMLIYSVVLIAMMLINASPKVAYFREEISKKLNIRRGSLSAKKASAKGE